MEYSSYPLNYIHLKMDFFLEPFRVLKRLTSQYLSYPLERYHHARRLSYYYFGYQMHELRIPSPSNHISKKLEAVKRNDIEEVTENVLNGTWGVNDVVSINNMTTMIHE